MVVWLKCEQEHYRYIRINTAIKQYQLTIEDLAALRCWDPTEYWLDTPIRPVHPYIRSRGILPVAGRTPSFDWSCITAVRH
jgi:hypothetical protein